LNNISNYYFQFKMIRVGTDCSGMDTPIYALKKISIPYSHEWACDIDKYARQTIMANYNPKRLYTDITTRDINDLPDIDLYVAGFPCQSFSIAGDMKGFNDQRGQIFFHCLDVINHKNPKYFILENVRGLYHHDKGNTFKVVMDELNKTNYDIYHQILNAKDYNIPQSRPRIYIVGIRKDLDQHFEFPEPIPLTKKLSSIVDYTDITQRPCQTRVKLVTDKLDISRSFFDQVFINFHKRVNTEFAECICASSMIYNGFIGRYANTLELLRLQGFDDDFKQVVSNAQMKKQIGNAMNVNVLMHLLKRLLNNI
jgi:DNA (cytosine-5)-methyltransferase 1